MAVNDNATMITNKVTYYVAPVGTPAPQLGTVATGAKPVTTPWVSIGHTDLEAPFSKSGDGGETTVKGSLQNQALRTTTGERTATIALSLEQFDVETLKYYLGANTVTDGGWLHAQSKAKGTPTALLAVAEDEESVFSPFYASKGELLGDVDFEIGDVEELDKFPVTFTALKEDTSKGLYGMHPVVPKIAKP